MTSGIFLVVFGDACYMRSAINLAISIKYFNPELPIALLYDKNMLTKGNYDMRFFDTLIELNEGDMSSPARIKTSIYKYLPYDYNLVLDVDALCLHSPMELINRCIDSGKNYFTYVYHTYKSNDPDEMDWLLWAYRSQVWHHFKLNNNSILPAPQSSIQFIKKCEESENLFNKINENISTPIPLGELRNMWGGNQPDELYLAGTLAQLNLNPHIGNDSLIFANVNDLKRGTKQIADEHVFLCVFGCNWFTRPMFQDMYDRYIITYSRKLQMNHCYKFSDISSGKHAATKNPNLVSSFNANQRNRSAINSFTLHNFGKMGDSVVIDSGKLIQGYENPYKRQLKITNWLNPSFIEYKDKKIFVYRMESKPWCITTKLGICLLDDNLIPVQSTNVLLNLHSELRGYTKGFHVEDPRLFSYNDELYLSYCDGYQMAQARINPDTLQAEESFYIKKPVKERTEKNWTFFEHNKKLFSVYQIHPHTIYEMQGENYSTRFETPFSFDWIYGIPRGGTSPVKIDNFYLSFFHSSIDSPKTKERQYFIGAYLFEDKEPFAVKYISKEPLLSADKVALTIPRLNSNIYVVFPGGVIRKEKSWLVVFGYQDYQCRYIEITDEELNNNLVAVRENKLAEV